MKDALAYEWVRIRTVRSTWLLTALALVLTALPALAITLNPASGTPLQEGESFRVVGDQEAYALVLTAGAQLAPLLMGLLGAFAFGHEYRYGTMRTALTALPVRDRLAVAKVLVVAVWAAVVGVLGVLVSAAVLLLFRGDRYQAGVRLTEATTLRVALGVVLYVVLIALLGLALGWLFRNVPAAVTVLLVTPLVVEPLLRALLSLNALEPISGIGRYLPYGAGSRLYAYSSRIDPEVPAAFRNDLGPLAGGLTLALVVAALVAVAHVLFRRRDA